MTIKILNGDCRDVLKTLPDQSVHTCVTSPPYFGLRDYGHSGQMGLEPTPDEFVSELVNVFREVRRVLRDDGTLWLNLGDSYAGSGKGRNGDGSPNVDLQSKQATSAGTITGNLIKSKTPDCKPKDLVGIPWRVAFALQADGWYLRQDIIWHKPNPMPESVTDRCTKAHEYIFLLSKSPKYYFDHEAIKEKSFTSPEMQIAKRNKSPHKGQKDSGMRETTSGFDKINKIYHNRNKRSVWTVTTKPFKGAHFATFPTDLIEPCILAGCPVDGIVLDPFGGAGTTGLVASNNNRNAILIELNEEYVNLSIDRIGLDATSLPTNGA
jgi:DNA modification methylase